MATWGDLSTLSPSSTSAVITKRLWRDGRNQARLELRQQLADAIGKGYDDVKGAYISLIAQCDLEAYDAGRRTKWWARVYYLLGLPAAVLAAAASATALASTAGRIPAGIIALVSAGLSAAVTFLDSESRRKHSDELSAGWQSLAESARVTLIQLKTSGTEESAEALETVVGLDRTKDLLLRGVAPDPSQQAVKASVKSAVYRPSVAADLSAAVDRK